MNIESQGGSNIEELKTIGQLAKELIDGEDGEPLGVIVVVARQVGVETDGSTSLRSDGGTFLSPNASQGVWEALMAQTRAHLRQSKIDLLKQQTKGNEI